MVVTPMFHFDFARPVSLLWSLLWIA